MVKPVVLVILDGFGVRKTTSYNAVKQAHIPFFKHALKTYPSVILKASGPAVGLPKGFIGNSEVGHLTLGAGQIIPHDLSIINKSIKNQSFFSNEVLNKAILHAKKNNTAVHLMGLLSDGGVHSHLTHLFALLDLCKQKNFKNVFIHCFLDGRDVPPKSAMKYVKKLERKMKRTVGKLATMIGRYYAMDRDKRWRREKKAYDLLIHNKGQLFADPKDALRYWYHKKITDEFIPPSKFVDSKGTIKNGDSVIFFNFRSDRARQLTAEFVNKQFSFFKTKKLKDLYFVGFAEYDSQLHLHVPFRKIRAKKPLGAYVSEQGKRQLRVAETEKYAHVTYFFNQGREKPYRKEQRILVSSPKVATYDLQPEMAAEHITHETVKAIRKRKHDLLIINFANPDMVGHTGNFYATLAALKVVDSCVQRIAFETLQQNGAVCVTADHGNCEDMRKESKTSHTTHLVPFLLITNDKKLLQKKLKKNKGLSAVAPSLLKLLKLPIPEAMDAPLW